MFFLFYFFLCLRFFFSFNYTMFIACQSQHIFKREWFKTIAISTLIYDHDQSDRHLVLMEIVICLRP